MFCKPHTSGNPDPIQNFGHLQEGYDPLADEDLSDSEMLNNIYAQAHGGAKMINTDPKKNVAKKINVYDPRMINSKPNINTAMIPGQQDLIRNGEEDGFVDGVDSVQRQMESLQILDLDSVSQSEEGIEIIGEAKGDKNVEKLNMTEKSRNQMKATAAQKLKNGEKVQQKNQANRNKEEEKKVEDSKQGSKEESKEESIKQINSKGSSYPKSKWNNTSQKKSSREILRGLQSERSREQLQRQNSSEILRSMGGAREVLLSLHSRHSQQRSQQKRTNKPGPKPGKPGRPGTKPGNPRTNKPGPNNQVRTDQSVLNQGQANEPGPNQGRSNRGESNQSNQEPGSSESGPNQGRSMLNRQVEARLVVLNRQGLKTQGQSGESTGHNQVNVVEEQIKARVTVDDPHISEGDEEGKNDGEAMMRGQNIDDGREQNNIHEIQAQNKLVQLEERKQGSRHDLNNDLLDSEFNDQVNRNNNSELEFPRNLDKDVVIVKTSTQKILNNQNENEDQNEDQNLNQQLAKKYATHAVPRKQSSFELRKQLVGQPVEQMNVSLINNVNQNNQQANQNMDRQNNYQNNYQNDQQIMIDSAVDEPVPQTSEERRKEERFLKAKNHLKMLAGLRYPGESGDVLLEDHDVPVGHQPRPRRGAASSEIPGGGLVEIMMSDGDPDQNIIDIWEKDEQNMKEAEQENQMQQEMLQMKEMKGSRKLKNNGKEIGEVEQIKPREQRSKKPSSEKREEDEEEKEGNKDRKKEEQLKKKLDEEWSLVPTIPDVQKQAMRSGEGTGIPNVAEMTKEQLATTKAKWRSGSENREEAPKKKGVQKIQKGPQDALKDALQEESKNQDDERNSKGEVDEEINDDQMDDIIEAKMRKQGPSDSKLKQSLVQISGKVETNIQPDNNQRKAGEVIQPRTIRTNQAPASQREGNRVTIRLEGPNDEPLDSGNAPRNNGNASLPDRNNNVRNGNESSRNESSGDNSMKSSYSIQKMLKAMGLGDSVDALMTFADKREELLEDLRTGTEKSGNKRKGDPKNQMQQAEMNSINQSSPRIPVSDQNINPNSGGSGLGRNSERALQQNSSGASQKNSNARLARIIPGSLRPGDRARLEATFSEEQKASKKKEAKKKKKKGKKDKESKEEKKDKKKKDSSIRESDDLLDSASNSNSMSESGSASRSESSHSLQSSQLGGFSMVRGEIHSTEKNLINPASKKSSTYSNNILKQNTLKQGENLEGNVEQDEQDVLLQKQMEDLGLEESEKLPGRGENLSSEVASGDMVKNEIEQIMPKGQKHSEKKKKAQGAQNAQNFQIDSGVGSALNSHTAGTSGPNSQNKSSQNKSSASKNGGIQLSQFANSPFDKSPFTKSQFANSANFLPSSDFSSSNASQFSNSNSGFPSQSQNQSQGTNGKKGNKTKLNERNNGIPALNNGIPAFQLYPEEESKHPEGEFPQGDSSQDYDMKGLMVKFNQIASEDINQIASKDDIQQISSSSSINKDHEISSGSNKPSSNQISSKESFQGSPQSSKSKRSNQSSKGSNQSNQSNQSSKSKRSERSVRSSSSKKSNAHDRVAAWLDRKHSPLPKSTFFRVKQREEESG